MVLISAMESMRPSHVALIVAVALGVLALVAFGTDSETTGGCLLCLALVALCFVVLLAATK